MGLEHLRDVGTQEGNAVAFLEAAAFEGRGKAIHALAEFAVSDSLFAVYDRDFIWIYRRASANKT